MIILYIISDNTLKIINPDDATDLLYYQEASLPTQQQVDDYNKSKEDDITRYFADNGFQKGIQLIREQLSTNEEKIPLYDIYSENLYIVGKFNVYNRVVYQHYRFPTTYFFSRLKKDLRSEISTTDPLEIRKRRKLSLMVSFLESFDLKILFRTYTTVFYLYANSLGKNITTCMRPSFLPHFTHIKPYYTRSEVINLALNMGIKLEDRYYDQEDINELCETVSSNDISADTLLKHQDHIISKNKVGLVQYYTLQGSYFINQYLRNLASYEYRNNFLESIITPMWELLNDAPAFDKSYTLYRFISNDNYLKHLNIGDMYTENGFTSTTRDPFYRSDLYKFGFILIRINIPKNVKGVALCVETISHFPNEQEIILSPLSIFRLDKKDEKIQYYNTDEHFKSQVKTRYEFTYIGKRPIRYIERPLYLLKSEAIDFMKINNVDTITLEEKIRYFIAKYTNPMFQFNALIGDNVYTVMTERYDSTGAYDKFYAINNQNGFSMYTLHNNYMLFMIELGEIENTRYMHVNYYVKYSVLDREKIVGDENFIRFISSVAYYFGISNAIIWADYRACDFDTNQNVLTGGADIQRGFSNKIYYKQTQPDKFEQESNDTSTTSGKYLGGSYCYDFYVYLKNTAKRYNKTNILNIELHPKFSYYQLDKLYNADYNQILQKDDQDELYQIYERVYKTENRENHNMADFYIWLVENKCYLVETLVFKMERFYNVDNPFAYDYYVLDPMTFLYNRRIIQTYPSFIVNASTITMKDSKNIIPINKYRTKPRKDYSI